MTQHISVSNQAMCDYSNVPSPSPLSLCKSNLLIKLLFWILDTHGVISHLCGHLVYNAFLVCLCVCKFGEQVEIGIHVKYMF